MIYLVQLCNDPTNIELYQLPMKSLLLVLVWTVWHCQDPTQFKEGQWKWYENGGPSSVVRQAHSQKLISHKLWSPPKKKQCSALGHVWSACQLEGQPNTHHCLHRHCLCRSPCQLTTAWTHSVCAGHPANSPLPGPTLRRSPLYAHSLSLKPKVPFTDNTKLSPPYWQYKAISPLLTIQSSPLYWQYKAITES